MSNAIEIVVDTKDDKPISALEAAKIIKATVKLLQTIETRITGKPPEIEWVLTSVKTVDTAPEAT